MARKKVESGGGPGSGDWLNTYADMVTLLLTFFILLYSMSSVDAAKFNMLVTAFAGEGEPSDQLIVFAQAEADKKKGSNAGELENVPDFEDLESIFQQLNQYVGNQGLSEQVDLSHGDGYVFIRFGDEMFFEPNSARLKANDLEILKFVGAGIKSVQGQVNLIRIDGHTAAIPGQPDYHVSDRILSTERANAVLMYFEDTIGIDSAKLQAMGYGKTRPIAPNETPEGQAKNRRVEILISSENLYNDQLDNIYERLVE